MTPLDLLPFALLGGALGLDVVSFPQVMISRPIVGATIAGAFAGSAMAGLLIGAVLELFALGTLPFGASRYPEWGSAAVSGGALYAALPAPADAALAVSVVAALSTAWASTYSLVWLRRINAHWARARLPLLSRGSGRTVIGLQLLGLTADLVRGTALTAVSLAVFYPLTSAAVARWTGDHLTTHALVGGLAAAAAGGAVWALFHAAHHARWLFLGGLAVGLLLVAFL